MRVSEIRVKRIRVNQGLGVLLSFRSRSYNKQIMGQDFIETKPSSSGVGFDPICFLDCLPMFFLKHH